MKRRCNTSMVAIIIFVQGVIRGSVSVMARSTHTVSQLANEVGIDIDEALIVLWDGGVEYVNSPTSVIWRRDSNKARRLVGLGTRRELASQEAWQRLFKLDDDGFSDLLETLDISVSNPRKLSRKVINRLKAESNTRGLAWAALVASRDGGIARDEPNNPPPKTVYPPLVWTVIGQERDVRYLTGDDVRAIHQELVVEFAGDADPISPPGVRDENLLESAVSRPSTSIGETKKYPSVEMAAAALLHSIIHNHAFHNGNKRTALVSMLAFLDLNRMLVTSDEGELFKLVIRIAQHSIVPASYDGRFSDREVLHIAKWISKNSRRIELGDRAIPFRRLRKLLSRYDCSYSSPRGNQIFVSRTIQRGRWLRREQTLTTQASYGDEGRDIDKVSIAKIRKDLQLDEPHGIDSASFYDDAPAAAGEFIVRFRKTLRRLARL